MLISQQGYRTRHQLQQGVSIMGENIELFNAAINGMYAIQSIFAQEFNDSMLGYSPLLYNDYPIIDASNRYFSSRKDISVDQLLTFPRNVDPNGVLQSFLSHDLAYASDNVVEYYKAVDNRYVVLLHIHLYSAGSLFY